VVLLHRNLSIKRDIDDPQVGYVRSVALSYTYFQTDQDDDEDDDAEDDTDKNEEEAA